MGRSPVSMGFSVVCLPSCLFVCFKEIMTRLLTPYNLGNHLICSLLRFDVSSITLNVFLLDVKMAS